MSRSSNAVFNSSKLSKMGDFMMLPIRFSDKLGLSMSAYAEFVYNKKQGMTHEVALDRAMDNAEKSQQSALPSQQTLLQKDSNSLTKIITMYTTGGMALVNKELQYVNQWKNGDITFKEMIRKVAVFHSLIPMTFGWVASGFPNPEDDPEEIAFDAMFGAYNSMPLFGSGLELVSATVFNTIMEVADIEGEVDTYRDFGLAPDLWTDGISGIHNLFTTSINGILGNGNVTPIEFFEATGDAIDLTGVPARNIFDILEGSAGAMDGEGLNAYLKMFGYSDYVIDNRGEKFSINFIG